MYDEITTLHQQKYAAVRLGDKWGVISISGKTLIPVRYDDIGTSLQKNRNLVPRPPTRVQLNNKWGFVDSTGKEVIPAKYDDIQFWYANIIPVKLDNKWAFVNKRGEELTLFEFDEIKIASNQFFLCRVKDKWGIVDMNGKEISPPIYNKIMYYDSTIAVCLDNKWGVVDITGKEIIPPIYNRIMFLSSTIAVYLDNNWGLIDYNGKILIQPMLKYNDIGIYSDSLAHMQKDDEVIQIFRLASNQDDSLQKESFINLSDDSLENLILLDSKVTDDFVEDESSDVDFPNVLDGKRRTEFLLSRGILEKDNIYIYNMYQDSMYTVPVEEVELIEKLNPFMGTEIGFKISNLDLASMGYFQWNTFVYIGDSNPFQTGEVRPIHWEQVDSSLFPGTLKSDNYREWYESFSRGKVFQFKTDDLTYLIQNLVSSKYKSIQGRHLIVYKDNFDSLIFNNVYMETESTGLSSLISENENFQWTGQIFKDKPSILFGFLWFSFGCPWIDFVGGKEPSIGILCDNRH